MSAPYVEAQLYFEIFFFFFGKGGIVEQGGWLIRDFFPPDVYFQLAWIQVEFSKCQRQYNHQS